MSFKAVHKNSQNRSRGRPRPNNTPKGGVKAVSTGTRIGRPRRSGGGTKLIAKSSSLPYSTTGYVPNFTSKTKGRNH